MKKEQLGSLVQVTDSSSQRVVANPPNNPIVVAWVAAIATNGGVAPTAAQQKATSDFVNGCQADGTWPGVFWCGVFCPTPGNVIAARTPLLAGPGFALWTVNMNIDSQANDLKGLHGDPPNLVSLSTGLMTAQVWGNDNNAGVSMIIPDQNGLSPPNGIEFGAYGPDNVSDMFIASSSSGNTSGAIWDGVSSVGLVASPGIGYYAINRIAGNNLKEFFGKTGVPVAQIGATQTTPGGGRWNQVGYDLRILSISFSGSTLRACSSYVSFICGHVGWTAVEEQLMFNRANTLRVAFGGGNV